jgi:pSer/pThr/pTyr-binding forkhead associated (FHA) protein
MPRLVINPGTNSAWEVQLKQGINKLGRSFDNDFKLEHSSVSGMHCEIVVENGNALLKDLNSTNGTFLNRSPVKEARLQPGQTIHLGGVELLYAGDAPTTATIGSTEVIPRPAVPPSAPPVPRLSISASRPAPPALEPAPATATYTETAPALAAPAPSAIRTFSGRGNCKFHPKTPARYHCGKCHLFYCELCVTTRAVGEGQHKFCRKCGTELMNVQVAAREAPKSFFSRLPGVFAYPFKGSGLFVLIVCTIVISALEFVSRGMLAIFTKMACYGYMFAFMQNIIHSTTSENEEMPSWPSMDDLGGGFTKFAACVILSFGVPLGLIVYAFFQDEESAAAPMSLLIPLIGLGCLYFPMSLLAVAMKDTPVAANPLIVVPAILKAPLEYTIAVVVMGIVLGMRLGGQFVLEMIFGHSITTHSMGELFAMFGARSLWQFVAVYLLAVNMRILGLLYVAKKDRLGWFSH